MGLTDKLKGRMACPVCQAPVDTNFGGTALLCSSCDTYLEAEGADLRRIPEDRLENTPTFGAPTSWTDLRAATFTTSFVAPAAQLAELAARKDAGVRRLEAKWPATCCVCGKSATRQETAVRVVVLPREWGIFSIGTKKVTLVAAGIPHCAVHSGGVVFDRVPVALYGGETRFGLLFRSLAARLAFRALNPWPWRRVPRP